MVRRLPKTATFYGRRLPKTATFQEIETVVLVTQYIYNNIYVLLLVLLLLCLCKSFKELSLFALDTKF